jgi:demethylmenaquinone methyltransferase/2-methoxy-6-polyprenyl-1,4-benzoquinol methylase
VWSEADLQANPHAAPDKADRVQSMFAAIAGRYDLNNRLHSFGRDQAWRRRAVRLAEVCPTDVVLDVACGTGDLTLAFAAAAPSPRSVTGVDFTDEMLDLARAKAIQHGLAGTAPEGSARHASSVTFLHADAMDLPFDAESFDIVSIAFGIRNVLDPGKAIREFHRVLRPGGRLVVLEFSKPRNRIVRWLNDFYSGTVMPRTASWIARDRSGAYRYLPRSIATFPESQQFIYLLAANGFSAITAHPLTLGICAVYVARR